MEETIDYQNSDDIEMTMLGVNEETGDIYTYTIVYTEAL